MTATTDRPRPPAPTGPIMCQPWCEYGDGRTDALLAADQYCVIAELFVPLSTAEPVHVDGRGMCEPEQLHVYAHDDQGHSEPRIVVSVGGGGAPSMTLAEAQQLVEVLQLIVGQAAGFPSTRD